jgi:hypothetical protein
MQETTHANVDEGLAREVATVQEEYHTTKRQLEVVTANAQSELKMLEQKLEKAVCKCLRVLQCPYV